MNGEIRINCLECPKRGKGPDRKKHLNINPAMNKAHCWRCEFGTHNAEAWCERNGIVINATWGLAEQIERPKIKLPPEYTQDFTRHTMFGKQALQYLTRRHITPALIAAYDIGHCPTGRYAQRIIIPVYENGVLVTFQGRDWTELKGKDERHRGATGGAPSAMFNLDRAAQSRVLLLVEGPFDALRIPKYGVGILGKGWNAEKRAKVLRAKPTVVLVCMDRDAIDQDQLIHEDLAGCIPYVQTVTLDPAAKDLGEATAEQLAPVERLCQKAALAAARVARAPQRNVAA